MASYRRIDFDTLAHEQEEEYEKMRQRWSQLFYQHLWIDWEDISVHEILERTMYASKFMAAIMEYEKTKDTAQWRQFVKLFIAQAAARNRKANLSDTFGSPVPGPSTRASPAAHWTEAVKNWQTSSTVYFNNEPTGTPGAAGATIADARLGAIGTEIAAHGRQHFKPMPMLVQDLRRYNYNPNAPGGAYWRGGGGGGGGGRGGRAGYRYEQKSYIPAKAYLNQQLQQKEEEEKKKFETPTLQ